VQVNVFRQGENLGAFRRYAGVQNALREITPLIRIPRSAFRIFFFVLAGRRPHRDVGLLRRGRAQPLDKRWLNRVGLRALAASAQLFHQTANA
jgi:hypothetical protein